jgi:virginiamycin B lyase
MQRFSAGMQRLTIVAALALLSALLVVSLTMTARAHADGVTAIGRANLDGTEVNQTFITGASDPSGLDVDAEYIYWTNEYGTEAIGRSGLDGTGVDDSFITPMPTVFGPADVAVDADYVYWTNHHDFPSYSIGRANLDGTDADQSFITTDTPYPSALAIDAEHVYWTSTNAIVRANIDGSGVEPHFIDLPYPYGAYGLAVDSGNIYWTNFSYGTVGRANLDGSGVDQSFITGLNPLGIDVDANHLYWTDVDLAGSAPSHSIGRANLDGSGVQQDFITGASYPEDVAVDAGHVYWVNFELPPPPCGHCYEEPPPPDHTPPNTTFTKDAPNKTFKTKVKFSFLSTDPDATFECRLDKKNWRRCLSPKTIRHLDEGRHRFRVRAVDPSGNVDPTPAKDKFRVVD